MTRVPRIACTMALLFGMPAAAAQVNLANERWSVSIDPATLAVTVTTKGITIDASRGGASHSVADLTGTDYHAQWAWPGDGHAIDAQLKGQDLTLTIRATVPGELDVIHQPGTAMGVAAMLPLGEGRYVPQGDTAWQRHLVSLGIAKLDESFSLPLWTDDHRAFSLSWLLPTAAGTTLQFAAEGTAVGIRATHRFSPLDTTTPLTAILHLDDADPLAGARRYRQWLKDNGRFTSLAQASASLPQADRLIGATHIYLWGTGVIDVADVRDWPAFLARLRSAPGIVHALRRHFGREALDLLQHTAPLNRYEQTVVVGAINAAMDAVAREAWIDKPVTARSYVGYGRLRSALADAMGDTLTPDPSGWGGILSPATVRVLRDAGLKKLWIGTGSGWEAGLWHPEALVAGDQLGYLLAPYDSYETALKPGDQPDWSTAHLGKDAYDRCSLIKQDGGVVAGFGGSGHYTDPRCVRSILQARIAALLASAPYNSWFLDAYAAGMLFESYRPGATLSLGESAAGYAASLSWINQTLRLPAGSEDGKASTAGGVLYAHGMQSPVFGWADPDLGQGREKRPSPYRLGGWFPEHAPTIFFRQVPLKPSWRRTEFDPVFRVPLYQTVFHDAIITSHHWTYDALKFADVIGDRELTQLLYNVPALYHLNAASLQHRLPIIRRNDAFFRPVHEVLAHQALVGFRVHDDARVLQETRFADGSRIIANFGLAKADVDGTSLPARSATALLAGREPLVFIEATD